MSQPLRKPVIGDCEFCSQKNLALFVQHGDLMCEGCIAKENTVAHAKEIIVESKKIDYTIQISSDLAQAETVAIVEIIAAVANDTTIPDDMKDFEVAKMCQDRVIAYEKAIFDKRAEILADESRMRVAQANAQSFAGKLRAELQAQLAPKFNLNYKTEVKEVKPRTRTTTSNFKASELKAACEKYGLKMEDVRMIAVSRNLTAEGAAKFLRERLDAKKNAQATN